MKKISTSGAYNTAIGYRALLSNQISNIDNSWIVDKFLKNDLDIKKNIKHMPSIKLLEFKKYLNLIRDYVDETIVEKL